MSDHFVPLFVRLYIGWLSFVCLFVCLAAWNIRTAHRSLFLSLFSVAFFLFHVQFNVGFVHSFAAHNHSRVLRCYFCCNSVNV